MRCTAARGDKLGLTEEELAFYDALDTNDSAVKVLGEPILKQIARELVQTVQRNVTIDWAERENVRAHLRRLVKRVLRKYGYPTQRETITATPDQRSYEVWFYAGLRGGAYFYFVDLTGFQDYTLVHSTVPGEPYAPDWQKRYLPLGPSGR